MQTFSVQEKVVVLVKELCSSSRDLLRFRISILSILGLSLSEGIIKIKVKVI